MLFLLSIFGTIQGIEGVFKGSFLAIAELLASIITFFAIAYIICGEER
jgi:hypothetical protein